MLVCDKCGAENPLGRIFCGSCGSKLDMTNISSDVIANRQKSGFFVAHYKKMLVVLAILAMALVGLALWPQAGVLGEKGTSVGSGRTRRQMGVLLNLASGRTITVSISEKDINGYLKHTKSLSKQYESCSVDLVSRGMSSRLVIPLVEVPLGKFKLKLKVSFDIRCVPVGGQVVVTGASVGHLPLWGPARALAVSQYRKIFASGKEPEVLSVLTEVRIEDGQAELSAGK